ncbi:BEN domain-containing protein 4-like [Calypte anna]|uniref:BEN domain-containing protein 4-like n=1 Tax=Calypte anna TaxID=9244 RepID=UPI0011C4007D|nr:BEN domain-containing protein 4-like [Calypte anna]
MLNRAPSLLPLFLALQEANPIPPLPPPPHSAVPSPSGTGTAVPAPSAGCSWAGLGRQRALPARTAPRPACTAQTPPRSRAHRERPRSALRYTDEDIPVDFVTDLYL